MLDPLVLLHNLGLIEDSRVNSYSETITVICPFHEEEFPSCTVYLRQFSFYCFGCSQRGDLYELAAKVLKTDKVTAAVTLIRNKIPVLKGVDGKKKVVSNSIRRKDLRHAAWIQYINAPTLVLPSAEYKYILHRGFSDKVVRHFDIRNEVMTDHPILIPLRSNGIFKGYVRRRIDNIEDNKYLYNKGFSRSTSLIGEFRKNVPVLVTEGIMDMMKAYQFGFNNFMCALGWKLSNAQISFLRKYTDTIICALDNTPKGKEGKQRLKKYFDIIDFAYSDSSIKDVADMNVWQFNYALGPYRRWLK